MFNGELAVRLSGAVSKVADFGNPVKTFAYQLNQGGPLQFANGTLDYQADLYWSDQILIASSGSQSLDLAGSLFDDLGVACNFAKIRGILVSSADANAHDLIIGNGTNPFLGPFGAAAHTAAVKPGGVFAAFAPRTGWPVTAATADILKLANAGAVSGITVDVHILGTSA